MIQNAAICSYQSNLQSHGNENSAQTITQFGGSEKIQDHEAKLPLEYPVTHYQSSEISDFRIQGPNSQHPLKKRVDSYACISAIKRCTTLKFSDAPTVGIRKVVGICW